MSDKIEWQIEEVTTYSMECNFCWNEFEGEFYDDFVSRMKEEFTYASSAQSTGWACTECMANNELNLQPKKIV